MSPRGVVAAGLALCAFAWASPAHAQTRREPGLRSDDELRVQELTAETRRAVREGIAWLAREQRDKSGRWPATPREYQMSVTALSGLALLAHGVTPDHGPYSENLRKCLYWVLDSQKTDGPAKGLLFRRTNPQGRKERPMHGHGFALLLLGEAYGQTRDPRLRKRLHHAIKQAIDLTERAMSRGGGWYYWPNNAHSQHKDEGSVTITQIQGLRSARNAGVYVNPVTIARAVDYIKRSQMSDGGIRYTLTWGKTSSALTAAGIAVLHGAGEYHSEAIRKAYGYLRQNLSTELPEKQRWFYYTHLYAVQAMFQRGGAEWASYWPRIRRELLERRKRKPYWDHYYGSSYATSISLLILQIPNRYLPIFQR